MRALIRVLTACTLIAPAFAMAQPAARPIRLIVASPPASPPDVAARVVAERLGPLLGRAMVVEDRIAGRDTVGIAEIAHAEPNGDTFGVISLSQAVTPAITPNLPFDTRRDLVPVSQVVSNPLALVVRGDAPYRSLRELITAARAKPGKLTYSSAGNATPPHLAAALLVAQADLAVQHVPYAGAVQAVTAVISGDVDFSVPGVAAAVSLVKAGRLRVLATTGARRAAVMPDVPTVGEAGFAESEVTNWVGVVAPSGTSREVAARFADDLKRVTSQKEVAAKLAPLGMEPTPESGPEAFRALLDAELTRWAKLAQVTGLRRD